MVYKKCPYCGASLDPNERCDCQNKKNGAAPQETEQPQNQSTSLIIGQKDQKVKEET